MRVAPLRVFMLCSGLAINSDEIESSARIKE